MTCAPPPTAVMTRVSLSESRMVLMNDRKKKSDSMGRKDFQRPRKRSLYLLIAARIVPSTGICCQSGTVLSDGSADVSPNVPAAALAVMLRLQLCWEHAVSDGVGADTPLIPIDRCRPACTYMTMAVLR